ncbi:hypothetical protein EC991_003060 [Linnemannia zychae]|nr:hypothetical protein EC991_003060 [Linnemannia zychae]
MKLNLILLGVLAAISSAAPAPAPALASALADNPISPRGVNGTATASATASASADVASRKLNKRCNSTTLAYRFYYSDASGALTDFTFAVSGTRPYNGVTGLSMHLPGDNTRYTVTSTDGKFSVLHGNAMNSDDVILIYGNRNYSYKQKSWEGMRGDRWVTEYWDCI